MVIAGSSNGHKPEVKFYRGDFGPRDPIILTKAATKQTIGYGADIYEEYGRSGLRHWGGFVFEEWLNQLQQGRRAAEVYREMSDQDPILGAMLYAIQMLIRRVDWWFEDQGTPGAQYMDGLINDMQFSWADTISELISFLPYGYSYSEICFKKREGPSRSPSMTSKFDDGEIGLSKIALRAQDSLWKWVFDETGDIMGMIQNPPPDYLLRFIPREKALHLRTTVFKDNPEGRSILRNAYRSWWFVKNIQQIEAIGVERDLAGLPVLIPPEGTDIWDTDDPAMSTVLTMAKNVVSSIRRDEQEGVILPFGWELTLLSSSGARQFDTSEIIGRYETRMATSCLADLVMMGQDKVGSYALAVTKKDLFAASLGAYLDIISNGFNTQVTPRIWELNGRTDEMPKLCHGSVETIDPDTLGSFFNNIGRAGAPIDWSTTLPWINKIIGAPAVTEGHDFTPMPVQQQQNQNDMAGNDRPPAGAKGDKIKR